MVRVRQKDGTVVDVTATDAVEILDLDRRLAVVITQDSRGSIHVSYPGEPLFSGYARLRGLPVAQVHQHADLPLKSPR